MQDNYPIFQKNNSTKNRLPMEYAFILQRLVVFSSILRAHLMQEYND